MTMRISDAETVDVDLWADAARTVWNRRAVAMRHRFWFWLCSFAYRRMRGRMAFRDLPLGVPGVRDVDAICTAYSPRLRRLGDWSECQGDGHFLCKGCALLRRDNETEI